MRDIWCDCENGTVRQNEINQVDKDQLSRRWWFVHRGNFGTRFIFRSHSEEKTGNEKYTMLSTDRACEAVLVISVRLLKITLKH